MRTRTLVAAAFAAATLATPAAAITLVDGTTQGLYNAGIGSVLNGTSAAFPGPGDPTLTFPTAPDLSPAAAQLGNWLTNPTNPGGTWGAAPQAIPATWTVGDETAIIYEIDAGATGFLAVNFSFGIDNGIFVWLDGVYQGGNMAPGGPSLGEFQFTLASLAPGKHYLQILREDHGGATGYLVQVTARSEGTPVPEPAPLALLAMALVATACARRRG